MGRRSRNFSAITKLLINYRTVRLNSAEQTHANSVFFFVSNKVILSTLQTVDLLYIGQPSSCTLRQNNTAAFITPVSRVFVTFALSLQLVDIVRGFSFSNL